MGGQNGWDAQTFSLDGVTQVLAVNLSGRGV